MDPKIGWTDHTHNFWWGCEKVSIECKFCYIDGIMRRGGREPFNGPMRTKDWSKPLKWQRRCEKNGTRLRIFTCSMSDFFNDGADGWRDEAWNVIRECDRLDWLILTKRPQNIPSRLPSDWGLGFPNVWLGTTCGTQSSMQRVALLTQVPAAIRFVSAEPLLGQVDFSQHIHKLDWIITGCEQAAKGKRRLMQSDWVRSIDQQCKKSGTAHFLKQYYRNNSGLPVTDGILDGLARQEFPTPRGVSHCRSWLTCRSACDVAVWSHDTRKFRILG